MDISPSHETILNMTNRYSIACIDIEAWQMRAITAPEHCDGKTDIRPTYYPRHRCLSTASEQSTRNVGTRLGPLFIAMTAALEGVAAEAHLRPHHCTGPRGCHVTALDANVPCPNVKSCCRLYYAPQIRLVKLSTPLTLTTVSLYYSKRRG